MPARPGGFTPPLNAKQTEDLDDQVEQLYRELNVLIDIFGLASKKGELLVRTDVGWAKVPAPTADGQVLTADRTLTEAMKWADAAGGAGNGALRFWLNGQPWGVI